MISRKTRLEIERLEHVEAEHWAKRQEKCEHDFEIYAEEFIVDDDYIYIDAMCRCGKISKLTYIKQD